MKNHKYFVYMMSSENNKALYVGVTSNLEVRVYQHKAKDIQGFTAKYNCNKLIWFAETKSIAEAINFEKILKAGSRRKKELLVRELNPKWMDLSLE